MNCSVLPNGVNIIKEERKEEWSVIKDMMVLSTVRTDMEIEYLKKIC